MFTANPSNFTAHSIEYELKTSTGTILNPTNDYISYSYNSTYITFSVYSTTLPTGTSTFYLVASFSDGYYPTYSV